MEKARSKFQGSGVEGYEPRTRSCRRNSWCRETGPWWSRPLTQRARPRTCAKSQRIRSAVSKLHHFAHQKHATSRDATIVCSDECAQRHQGAGSPYFRSAALHLSRFLSATVDQEGTTLEGIEGWFLENGLSQGQT